MDKTVINVEDLSKRYRIGLREEIHETIGGAMVNWIKSPILNFRRLRKLSKFNKNSDEEDIIWALKDVSFRVNRGEVVGIIGRNGAGKSTLLKILSRIVDPTTGRAIVKGKASSLLEVGTGFHLELTGRENIYLNGAILGMTKKEIDLKFCEIVDFSGVERFIDTPVKRYSSGMKVRLAFAIAAHLEPEILLVDEVLAVGDLAFQKKCLGKMDEATQEGRTILFVSHNMQAIRALCPRSILIEEGHVIADESTDYVIEAYYNLLKQSMIDENSGVSSDKNRRGFGEVRISKVRVMDATGKERYNFQTGDTIKFHIEYKVKRIIEELYVSVSLLSGLSREVVTATDEHLISKKKLYPGYFDSVIIELPNINLLPGEYPLYFWLGCRKNRRAFDVVDDLTSPLSITADFKDGDEIVYATKNRGYFKTGSRLI